MVPLEQEFPDKADLIDRLRHRDQTFRRLATYYESLSNNIALIESGQEEAGPDYLDMLRNQRDQARRDLVFHLENASAS